MSGKMWRRDEHCHYTCHALPQYTIVTDERYTMMESPRRVKISYPQKGHRALG